MSRALLCTFPRCPSCGHEVTNDEALIGRFGVDLYALAPNEGRIELKCPACEVRYMVQGGYVPTYTTALNEDDL